MVVVGGDVVLLLLVVVERPTWRRSSGGRLKSGPLQRAQGLWLEKAIFTQLEVEVIGKVTTGRQKHSHSGREGRTMLELHSGKVMGLKNIKEQVRQGLRCEVLRAVCKAESFIRKPLTKIA